MYFQIFREEASLRMNGNQEIIRQLHPVSRKYQELEASTILYSAIVFVKSITCYNSFPRKKTLISITSRFYDDSQNATRSS